MDQTLGIAQLQELAKTMTLARGNDERAAGDTQATSLTGVKGACPQNLFLKDKKGRFYIVTAREDTKVDLKVLSARLGTGKGGVRLAPDELIPAVLQVPLGRVTPLAITQPGTAGVVLLLDQKLRSQPHICVPNPLNNTMDVLVPEDLESIIRSLGREPAWVDLEAEPPIDKDNPPDLKQYADLGTPLAADNDAAAAPAAAVAAAGAPAAPAGGKKGDKKAAAKKGGAGTAAVRPRGDDVLRLTDELVDKIASTLLGEASPAVDADGLRRLKLDVEMQLNALRNAAYAGGFSAAKVAITNTITGQYA